MQTNKNTHKPHPAGVPCEVCKKIVEENIAIYQKPDYSLTKDLEENNK